MMPNTVSSTLVEQIVVRKYITLPRHHHLKHVVGRATSCSTGREGSEDNLPRCELHTDSVAEHKVGPPTTKKILSWLDQKLDREPVPRWVHSDGGLGAPGFGRARVELTRKRYVASDGAAHCLVSGTPHSGVVFALWMVVVAVMVVVVVVVVVAVVSSCGGRGGREQWVVLVGRCCMWW
jgi:hypothetical protein